MLVRLFVFLGICMISTGFSANLVSLDAPGQRVIIVGQGRTLQAAFEAATGTAPPMVREPGYQPAAGDLPIYISPRGDVSQAIEPYRAQLDAEGYLFLVETERIIIEALPATTDSRDPLTCAQADFARRFLGVDALFPGDLGRVVRPPARLVVPLGLHLENPAYLHRHWSGYAGAGGPGWRLRASGGGGRFRFHHNLYNLINPARHADHPEYFPVINPGRLNHPMYSHLKPGERFVPAPGQTTYWQPCTSHPDVLRIAVETIDAYFTANPKATSYSLGVNDSGGFCNCPRCLADSPPGVEPAGDAANGYRMYRFYNAIAEQVAVKHPDVRLGFLIYSDLSDWYPEQLHPLLMPYLTLSFADCWDPAYKERLYAHISRWGSIAHQIGIYEYFYGYGFMIPRLYLHAFAEGLRFAHAHGARGFYAEAYPAWGLDGPKLWVAEKLLWNPELEVAPLLDTWCRELFGDAAPAMRAYFDYLEAAWANQQPTNDRRGMYRLYTSQYKAEQFTEVFPPDVCDRAWALLAMAERQTSDPTALARLRYFRDSFGATRLASHRFASAMRLQALPATTGLPTWLHAMEGWAGFPDLESYMAELQPRAPFAFHEFSQEHFTGKHQSFAAWDTEAPVVRRIIDTLTSGILARTEAETDAAMHARLEAVAGAPLAKAIIEPLATGATMTASTPVTHPVVDARLTEWGEPSFQGSLLQYPYELRRDAAQTTCWVAVRSGRLYMAAHCIQAPDTTVSAVTGYNDLTLSANGWVQPGDNARLFPYLRGDSFGVAIGRHALLIATPAGGIFNGRNSAGRYYPTDDGATVAVAPADDGWIVELSMELPVESQQELASNGRLQLNFFRLNNGRRSCWVAAVPRRWSLHPNSLGWLFADSPPTPPANPETPPQ